MAETSCAGVWWGRRGVLLLFWISIIVSPSLLQPPLPLSLPVHMSVVPASWQFLPLSVSQAELGPLFSNSSPFSFSKSLFMVPPPGQAPIPGFQASFGRYSVTQLISEPALPLSAFFSATLLSKHVEKERDKGRGWRFRVRTLFHKRGQTSTQGTCITLHAFKETEEHKVSCITQPPLGLCMATLTLPSDWFEAEHTNQSHQDLWHNNIRPGHMQRRERQQRGHHHRNVVNRNRTAVPSQRYHLRVEGDIQGDLPRALRYQRVPKRDQIQLYYSVSDTVAELRCVEDRESQPQSQLFHIKAVTLKEEEEGERGQSRIKEDSCLKEEEQEEEELSLDPHVTIRYHRGPVLVGQPIRVSVNVRANFTAEFVVIRLKVKKGLVSMVAQRTLTSDLWTVNMERSQGSKQDVLSILCHKNSTPRHTYSPTLLQQVACLSVNARRQSFSVAMTVSANWWVEYSGQVKPSSLHAPAVSIFSFTDRHILSIAPITESNTIINTAILTNQPVSLPVIVLAVNHDGSVSDVTSAVMCSSANENTVKVTSNCSALFVDGSESGVGDTCAIVDFFLGALRGSVCVEVWAPSVPLHVSLADPVLNAIDGWNYFTNKGCEPVYQRSSVQVLTQFTAQDTRSRTTHLLGSSDWFVDVTELVLNWLRVEDPRVATLGTQNNVIGLQPGKTSLHVVSEQWDGLLGRCDITVTSDLVTTGDLSVQVVSGLGMSIRPSPTHPSIVTTTVTAYNILYNHHQEATISLWLQFSDDTASLLSFFSDLPFFLRLSSLAETVVVVTPGPSHRIFAQGDGGGPLLRAELLVSTCPEEPITTNSINENERDWSDIGEKPKGGTRRLAKGSGWIRVNLDMDFLQPIEDEDEEGERFELDVSDTLVESNIDIYASNLDEAQSENVNSDYYDKIIGKRTDRKWNEMGNGGMVSRNNLERAVLMPSQEESAVYISPIQKKEEKREEDVKEELELGVGAFLSLLCLSAVLFLANCLPCALRDRRRKMMNAKMEGELEEGTKLEEDQEREKNDVEDKEADLRNKEAENKIRLHYEMDSKDQIKEVEIIC